MDFEIKNRIDDVLNSSESKAQLIKLVEQLKIEGWSQLKVYDVFEKYMRLLDEEKRETELDAVCDVLDFIYGWCAPSSRLFSQILSNEEIDKYREAKQ